MTGALVKTARLRLAYYSIYFFENSNDCISIHWHIWFLIGTSGLLCRTLAPALGI
jgi:hypothetical protein